MKKNKSKKETANTHGRYGNMTYRDLKRLAIMKGMPFPDAVEGSFFGLMNYLEEHSGMKVDKSLIDKYDDWVDKILEDRGYQKGKSLRSPSLRLGFIGEKDEDGNVKSIKRIKGIKKEKKKPRERTEDGLYKGTKKSIIFEYAKKGFSLERTIRRAKKKYPDISEKSAKIWYRAAIKQLNKEK